MLERITNQDVTSPGIVAGAARALLCLFLLWAEGDAGWTSFDVDDIRSDNADFNYVTIEGRDTLWGATNGAGAVRYAGGRFDIYTALFGELSHDNVQVICLCTDALGDIWFGTDDGITVYQGDDSWLYLDVADGLTGNRVTSIAVDGSNDKWIGTRGGGISIYSGGDWDTISTSQGLAHNDVFTIAFDHDGIAWVGTGNGVSACSSGVCTTFDADGVLADVRIYQILVDNSNRKWIATENGVYVYTNAQDTWTVIDNPDTFGENIFYSVLEDKYGYFWLGTHGGGVKKFSDTSYIRTFTTADSLIDNTVTSIAVDSNGVFWFATPVGLGRYQNNPPEISSIAIADNAEETIPYTFDASASDPNGDSVVYSLVVCPQGMTVDLWSGLVAWTPGYDDSGDTIFSVEANDRNGGRATITISLWVANLNRRPEFTATVAVDTVLEDAAYTFDGSAKDADGDVLYYSLLAAPYGMAVGSTDGQVTWTPDNDDVGDTAFSVRAWDGNGGADTITVILTVLNTNDAPSIVTRTPSVDSVTLEYAQDTAFSIVVSDDDGDPLTYLWFQNDTQMSATTANITWNGAAAGHYVITVLVQDGNGGEDSVAWHVIVREPPVRHRTLGRSVTGNQMTVSPNPCREVARVSFGSMVQATGIEELAVFDVSGKTVRTLSGKCVSPTGQVVWNRTDREGRRVPSGTYILRLRLESSTITRRIVVED